MLRISAFAMGLLLVCGACSTKTAKKPFPNETAPANFRVKFDTTKGPFIVEMHRDWAPIGADRFYTLVRTKFFDGNSFFRVMPGFVVQFGIAADPRVTANWTGSEIVDDPVKHSNELGTITFAKTGAPDSRTTQLFLNINDNAALDAQGFAPFGSVVSGMNVVEEIYEGYREAPNQTRIEREGNSYLQQEFPKLDYIKTATIQ
jgi:peptidyl-prolyl cis-trans isomerase A (cyclophilin A)